MFLPIKHFTADLRIKSMNLVWDSFCKQSFCDSGEVQRELQHDLSNLTLAFKTPKNRTYWSISFHILMISSCLPATKMLHSFMDLLPYDENEGKWQINHCVLRAAIQLTAMEEKNSNLLLH